MTVYRYIGDRFTDPDLIGRLCIRFTWRGRQIWRNGKAVVRFDNGRVAIVLARRLRRQTAVAFPLPEREEWRTCRPPCPEGAG